MGKWIERPYGWKYNLGKKDGEEVLLIRILPDTSTVKAVGTDALCQHGMSSCGLRGHPDVEWEHVQHRGYVDEKMGRSRDSSLEYTALPRIHDSRDTPFVARYADGGVFYSVFTDETQMGFYHRLANIGRSTIELKIRVRPK